MLGSVVEVHVDEKLVPDDRFDDLTTVNDQGDRERIQIKHTDSDSRHLTLATFTGDTRGLRLDRLLAAALADRNGPGSSAREISFRILLCDAHPVDERLLAVLRPADPDPGPFLPGFKSARMRFNSNGLWPESEESGTKPEVNPNPFSFIREGESAIARQDLDWVCDRLIVEVNAPTASLDLTAPGAAEQLLLERVRSDVGAGIYPNSDRSAVDVAEALIGSARGARQGALTVTATELLRRTRLRSDFGAVARAHPVDKALEVPRAPTVSELVRHATTAAREGNPLLLVGPPGQGKSWICQQLLDALSEADWLVAEHYCFLGDADGERLPRVLAESIFGSLLARISEHNPSLVANQRPRFAAHEQALVEAVTSSIQEAPTRPVALVVDGIDHVTRVIAGGQTSDPSFSLAEALAALGLPKGSVLIVLSQPGGHLEPFQVADAITVRMPGLTDIELRKLAARLGLVPNTALDDRSFLVPSPLLTDDEAVGEFTTALSERSKGNALYATYLCREASRSPTTTAGPSATVRRLPHFDESLLGYYEHIQASLGAEGAWVADVIALLDFPVSRAELKEIRPDMAHRVDPALDVLRPVLVERATQGGIRVYHESFARFLRRPFQDDAGARTALFDRVIEWLDGKGLFNEARAFRHLLPALSEANHHERVVAAVDRDFVVKSIAAGFPASAIARNLATAVSSAARTENWPAVARYVEMSRAAQTYQEERFESAIVGFVDVVGTLLGIDTLTERLLHDGRPIMAAREGLQMCAAVDMQGAVAPWYEYMRAFLRESKDDNTLYGEAADRAVDLAWLRGRLRLSSLDHRDTPDADGARARDSSDENNEQSADRINCDLHAPVDWKRLAKHLNKGALHAEDVVAAILDTYGLSTVVDLIGKLDHPNSYCLALAEKIAAGEVSDPEGDEWTWVSRATALGLPLGYAWRLFRLGLNVGDLDLDPIETDRERILNLTRSVQDRAIRWETGRLEEWMDACTIAARRDLLGLGAAEALLTGPGWYTCWLRFTVALAIAEATSAEEQSRSGLDALRILTEVTNPFLGEPRACDLYPIHGRIEESIRRAMSLLNDQDWDEALGILDRVSSSISTTISGEMGGPLSRDRLLHIAVDTATSTRQDGARQLTEDEIKNGGGGRYYSDLAEYRLIAARLALTSGCPSEAYRHWTDACGLLTAYGWHKDTTVFELLDPLSFLISVDPARGRACVAKLQPLCERVPQHTDGRETRHAWSRWWELLAAADPCALARLTQPRLLSACNDPNSLLHGARSDLWRAWHRRADPVVAGILRLTLEEPLDKNDLTALRPLAEICDGTGSDPPARLATALIARADERPFKYSYSNSDDLLSRDRELVDELNAIAARAGVSQIAPLPARPLKADDSVVARKGAWQDPPVENITGQVTMMFPPGAIGIGQAIRVWRGRRYDDERPSWSVERFANVLGYRLVELAEDDREVDAAKAIRLIADAGGFYDKSKLIYEIAEGLERLGHGVLAAVAFTLAWTRARGGGGWLTFGGETAIESLQRATQIEPAVVRRTIAEEIEETVYGGYGTRGIAQALMYGFAKADLGKASSIAFDIWDEAFAVIADRAPRVSDLDDPDDVYEVPNGDSCVDLPGDLNAAFAAAAVGGLAHASREQKRRSLVAVQMSIVERPSAVASGIETALLSLSDPATLTWLLRVLERAGKDADPVISACRSALKHLLASPYLTVRALARRLLPIGADPLATSSKPDPALLEGGSQILLPERTGPHLEDPSGVVGMIEEVAGSRLARGDRILPGFRAAVRKRVATEMESDLIKRRMKAQLDAYADKLEERWPDAFLAHEQAVEDAIQWVAAGGRAARLMNGEPVADPVEFEDSLAKALLDDPELPIALECTRQPRPDIPPPPTMSDPIWESLRACADGSGVDDASIVAALDSEGALAGTVALVGIEAIPKLKGGPYSGWRLLAVVERRVIPRPDRRIKEDEFSERYQVVELRMAGDRQALTLPPVARGSPGVWTSLYASDSLGANGLQSQPIVGINYSVDSSNGSHHGLGAQKPLLVPTAWLAAILELRPHAQFVLQDDNGEAVALITWRTEYETSDYHHPWPRLCGAGLAIRGDLLDRAMGKAEGRLVLRDFMVGSTDLRE